MIRLNQRLLDAIATSDYETYSSLCSKDCILQRAEDDTDLVQLHPEESMRIEQDHAAINGQENRQTFMRDIHVA